jgi:hypothetical protein
MQNRNLRDTFTKYVFGFFEPFFARLASKFSRSANMTKKNFFIKKDIKNAEFHAYFEFVEKVVKNAPKKKFDEHE